MRRERRSEPRFDARIAMSLGGKGHDSLAYTRNLSVGGALLECSELLSHGEVIELRFSVPTDPEPITVTAEVRWIARSSDGAAHGVGVRFGAMRAREMRAWAKYVRGLKVPSP